MPVFCLLVGGVNAVTLFVPRFGLSADDQRPRDKVADAASKLLDRAMKLERQGSAQEALVAYEDITKKFAGTDTADVAQKLMESLRARVS